MADEHRRNADPHIQSLIDKVDGLSADLKPIREFMEQVNAAKKAAIWLVGVIAAMGAVIKWFFDVKDHIHPNGR